MRNSFLKNTDLSNRHPIHSVRILCMLAVCVLALQSQILAGESDLQSRRHLLEGFTQPYRTIQLAAGDSGRVVIVNVKDGDSVAKGQLLLQLDTSVLEARRQIAQSDIDATAKINRLKVEHDVRKRRLEQLQALEGQGRGSTEEMLRGEADEQVALFNLKEAEEEREKFKLRLKEIEADIAARHVTCPIDGVATDVKREIGEFVSPSDPVVVSVVDLSKLRAIFYLPTSTAIELKQGAAVAIHLVETDTLVNGKIEVVGQVTEAESGRVQVRVLIDNRQRKYRSGLRCVLRNTNDRSTDHPPKTASRVSAGILQ